MKPICRILVAILCGAIAPEGTRAAYATGRPFGTLVRASAKPFGGLDHVSPRRTPVGKFAFRLIAYQEAKKAGLPYALVDAVMKIESGYHPEQVGDVGEIGLMQIRPGTAAMLGFHGPVDGLANPAVNIHYGTTYLGKAWRLAGGDVCRALMKYRAGHGEEVMSTLSANYCARARAQLLAEGSPLARTIKPSDLVAVARPLEEGDGRARRGSKRLGFWAHFKDRVGRINARIEAKWARNGAR